ncbi:Uncharacterized protein TCM_022497 [Theobroma cacao]|uniref:Pleiotropic ABC efflux transporter N-terminal domain-containing protein n=1 Tax=Theobroma cacao TaxID=3641 RepID=A0A061ET25_THECC|nr:Uncharacterized protein TCM_022497 [Theobroma cacao]
MRDWLIWTGEEGEDPTGFRYVQGKTVSARGRREQDGPRLDHDQCFIRSRLQTICGSIVVVAGREHRRDGSLQVKSPLHQVVDEDLNLLLEYVQLVPHTQNMCNWSLTLKGTSSSSEAASFPFSTLGSLEVLDSGRVVHVDVDVIKLGMQDKKQLMDSLLKVAEEDNENFLRRLSDRTDRVGIEIPMIEVRFKHLAVEGDVYVGSRAFNSYST